MMTRRDSSSLSGDGHLSALCSPMKILLHYQTVDSAGQAGVASVGSQHKTRL